MSERREAAFTAADAQWLHNRLADEGRDPSTVVAVMIEWGLLRLVPRLEALEGERESEEDRVCELHLCDVSRLHLRPGVTYRFVAEPDCEGCQEAEEAGRIPDGPTPTPEPGEPKVVGYVRADYLNNFPEYADSISPRRTVNHMHPVILQSDHEAVVRGLRERLDKNSARSVEDVNHLAGICRERHERIQELKAENERLTDELEAAAASLEAISQQGGRTEFLGQWGQVRGYANSRARVARDALKVGPTPSDSTEGESVEGRFMLRYMGAWGVMGACVSPDWPHGTPVKITRIPTPGGDDGEE